MSEPSASYEIQTRAAQETLWHKAPAWRSLTVAASLLTLAALAVPALLPHEAPVPAAALAALESVSVTPSVTLSSLPPPPAHRLQVATATLRAQQPLVLTPQALPQTQTSTAPAQTVCTLKEQATAPVLTGLGTVTAFEDRAEAMARIQVSEAQRGGPIDPDYVQNARVFVQHTNGQVGVYIVPNGMTVAIGDRVTLQNGYRNTALPCNYVPFTIASDIGPPPPPAARRAQ